MMMQYVPYIAVAAAAALVAFLITHFVARGRIVRKDAELQAANSMREREAALREEQVRLLREDHEKDLQRLKESHDKALESARTALALENEKALKAREEALRKEAEETMKGITAALNKDIRDMKDAFDAQKRTSAEEGSAIRTKFDETVKSLRAQTEAIGTQAVDLANALKGKNKMQGIFGETILEKILEDEGLRKGRDYDSESWIRDRSGIIVKSEDSGQRMRPDFVLHFPDETDILLDAKVSLTALSDYFAADTDKAREEASQRNLQSVNDHVRELSDKQYQKFVKGRKTLDYVIMFIPNYGAYQLAKQEDPDIFSRAFSHNVLITTEETLIPFLRLIRSAWVQKEQMENMEEIVQAARKMIDRVALYCKANAEVEEKLRKALEAMEDNSKRLIDGRQSIVRAAQEVVDSGVSLSPGRELPSPVDTPLV